jgi:thiol-disulfide isomerase/thioredoxin
MRLFIALILFASHVVAQETAPDLTLPDRDGNTQRLSAYRGKLVVLNFWATWCGPCKDEMPMLARLAKDHQKNGVEVIAVSLDDAEGKKKVPKFIKEAKMKKLPVWLDATTDHLDLFKVGPALPATVFIDRDGRIIRRVLGQLHPNDLHPTIEWMLSDRSAPAPPALTNNVDKKAD